MKDLFIPEDTSQGEEYLKNPPEQIDLEEAVKKTGDIFIDQITTHQYAKFFKTAKKISLEFHFKYQKAEFLLEFNAPHNLEQDRFTIYSINRKEMRAGEFYKLIKDYPKKAAIGDILQGNPLPSVSGDRYDIILPHIESFKRFLLVDRMINIPKYDQKISLASNSLYIIKPGVLEREVIESKLGLND